MNMILRKPIVYVLLLVIMLTLSATVLARDPAVALQSTLVPSLTPTPNNAAQAQLAIDQTLTAIAQPGETFIPSFTLTPTEVPLVITLPPTTGDKIPPPIEIELPESWLMGYDAQVLPDVEPDTVRVIPVAVYTGPITGGTGTIVLYWGFPNLVTPSNEVMAQSAMGMTPNATVEPDLWSDGVRLLRSAVIEPDCNIGVDVRRSYRIGLLSAVGTQWSAVSCASGLPDTRGWFAGVKEQGINFVFYVFSDPITAMDTGSGELQAILDTVRFHVVDVTLTPSAATPTPAS
ncbi:MAG: hypothetical protein JNJ78_22825 [Anaerolineae bacterium]|nr:hypothetical protein [Anaerolineae bacterium]